MVEVKFLGKREVETEWAGEEDEVFTFQIDGDTVEIVLVHPSRARREKLSPIMVVWKGVLPKN
ncbi:MAG: hypothetical protein QW734_07100 [Candidatus Bathyarchaeia archaeon]